MMGGQVDLVTVGVPPALPHIRAGKVRPLAVLTSPRLAKLPDVPTGKEAGFENFEVITWYGILAPAGTPREIVGRLNRELASMHKSAEMKERMEGVGFDPLTSTPEEFAAFIKTDIARWAKVIKESNLQIEQ